MTKGGVFALGNFDGVHRGHRAVIDTAVRFARTMGVPARVLTFEPHPRVLFQPDLPPFRLTSLRDKEDRLKALGVEDVLALPFTQELAQKSAAEFVDHILLNQLGVAHVVAGHDFVFGRGRSGDMKKLAAWLEARGIGVTEVAAAGEAGEVFSSSRVRELLLQGQIEAATTMLGHPWVIAGTIVEGQKRGRTIGAPTANIGLGDYLRPKFGVYTVQAGRVGEPMQYRGVANIGQRPTVKGVGENLEAHLFDFDADIYGQEWRFALTHFLRPEQKFDNFDALKEQIARDIAQARAIP